MSRLSGFARKDMALVAIVVLSVALGFSLAANFYHSGSGAAIAAPPAQMAWQTAFETIARDISPSVVNITSERYVDAPTISGLDDFFRDWPFGPRQQTPQSEPRERQKQQAAGTGVIVRSDGYILTNNHVVADADKVTVKLSDGRKLDGKVTKDPTSDLAIVKIDAKDLAAASFADSDKVKVGQWVAAIGNPFELENTITVGVISAYRRWAGAQSAVPVAGDVIQTDAAINPGNSGGPLVDLEGRIVGINSMIKSPSGGNVGVGFAIPSNTAKYVMTQLIEKGKVVRGYMGIEPIDLSPVMRDKLGATSGALVNNVTKDSPAEKGGIKQKDVIVSIQGKKVESASDLKRITTSIAPGTTVDVVVVRDKKEKKLNVKLGDYPAEATESGQSGDGDKIGLSVQPLTPELAKQLKIDESIQGVVVRRVKPGSAAASANIRQGDVITEIDNQPITSVATFAKAVEGLKSGDTAIVVVQRGERSTIVEMPID